MVPEFIQRTSIIDSQGEDIIMNAVTLEEELGGNGYQEEIGFFKKGELDYHALVLAQGWPSWSFALDGLGFQSICTLASFESVTSREEFMSTDLGDTLISNSGLNPWLEKHNENGVLFVQGEREFLESVYHKTNHLDSELKLVYVCTDPSFHTADGFRVSHESAGGVTDGKWTCYIEGLKPSSITPTSVKRKLRHLLRTTEGPSSKRALAHNGGTILLKGDLAPWKNKRCQVRTTSVFTKDELIDRLLTIKEWMDIYDIELLTQASLLKLQSKRESGECSLSFISQIPIKVLRMIAMSVVEGDLSPIENDRFDEKSLDSCDSNATILVNNISNINIDDDDSVGSLDGQSLAGEASVGSATDVAARPDDAEADIQDWDKWSVESFTPIKDQIPLVCNGVYNQTLHEPLFTSLRKLLIRRYRKNVLQSLLRYLHKQHSKAPNSYLTIHCLGKSIRVSSWVKTRRQTSKKAGRYWNLHRDLEVGRDAVTRAAWSTWWNWDVGSTLYFWRWPSGVMQSVRDGTKLFVDCI